ncbi:MAG: hypothetical protein R2874_09550 [Desulfobacterales bacterium]
MSTAESLHDRLAVLGAEVLKKTLKVLKISRCGPPPRTMPKPPMRHCFPKRRPD